ncbi:MAG: hypothetical protein WC532_00635 [Candidatus Omnitrophota bacterium]
MLNKIISLVLSFGLLFQQISFAQIATELNLSNYLSKISSNIIQEKFRPLHLRYFSYDSLNDNFKILLDKGSVKQLDDVKAQESAKTLLSYFLIGVTLPDEAFWVNLRPDTEDQIIDPSLEKTDVGKIMLEADLQLKKDTALFTSPKTPEGKEYWNKLYKKAGELCGNDNVTIPTLTRPWIVPGEIIVREAKDSAYVYKATLKVMLEQDYLKDSATYSFKDERSKALNEYSSQLIRELIIPKLTKEVNSSKRYAALRQVYYSLILSRWFKLRFSGKTGTYASLINTKNLTNLVSQEAWSKTEYFKQYKKSFAEGEYSIQEPVYTPTGQVIRSYFSGGINVASSAINTQNGAIFLNDNANKLGDVIGGRAVLDLKSINLKPIAVSSPITNPDKVTIEFPIEEWSAYEDQYGLGSGPTIINAVPYALLEEVKRKFGKQVIIDISIFDHESSTDDYGGWKGSYKTKTTLIFSQDIADKIKEVVRKYYPNESFSISLPFHLDEAAILSFKTTVLSLVKNNQRTSLDSLIDSLPQGSAVRNALFNLKHLHGKPTDEAVQRIIKENNLNDAEQAAIVQVPIVLLAQPEVTIELPIDEWSGSEDMYGLGYSTQTNPIPRGFLEEIKSKFSKQVSIDHGIFDSENSEDNVGGWKGSFKTKTTLIFSQDIADKVKEIFRKYYPNESFFVSSPIKDTTEDSSPVSKFVTLPVNKDEQGLDFRDVEKAIASGRMAIAEVSVDWAEKIKKTFPDEVYTIFISPLSEEQITERMRKKGQAREAVIFDEMTGRQRERAIEKPTDEKKQLARAQASIIEMSRQNEYDIVIVNNVLKDLEKDNIRWAGEEGAKVVSKFMGAVDNARKDGKKLILYSGPSATGKSPLWNQIQQRYGDQFSRIVLHTTRPMRDGEENGVDFHFSPVTKDQIEKIGMDWNDTSSKLVKNGWAQQVSPTEVIMLTKIEKEKDKALEAFGDNLTKILQAPVEQLKELEKKINASSPVLNREDDLYIPTSQGEAYDAVMATLTKIRGTQESHGYPLFKTNIDRNKVEEAFSAKKATQIGSVLYGYDTGDYSTDYEVTVNFNEANITLTFLSREEKYKLERPFSEERVRGQLFAILWNIGWAHKNISFSVSEEIAIDSVENRHLLAGPGTDDEHYQDEPGYQELREAYDAVMEKIKSATEAKINEIINWVKENPEINFKIEEVYVLGGTGQEAGIVGRIDRGIAEKLGLAYGTINFLTQDISKKTDRKNNSSPVRSMSGKTGGIDFRALPMAIQPMGSFGSLNFTLPQLSQVELEKIDVAAEIQQIKNMVQSGIIPSGERVKYLIAACEQKGEINSQVDNLLLCLTDIFKLEEENASESSPELREALVIVDMQA